MNDLPPLGLGPCWTDSEALGVREKQLHRALKALKKERRLLRSAEQERDSYKAANRTNAETVELLRARLAGERNT